MQVTSIIKKSHELTLQEIKELNDLARIVHQSNPENHIEVNHIQKRQPIFDLYKVDGKIVAAQNYNFFKLLTPFSKKPLHVNYIGFTYKNPAYNAYIKNYAVKSGLKMYRYNMGRFWWLKNFVLILISHNPKLITRTGRSFKEAYLGYGKRAPTKVHQFLQDFYTNQLHLDDDSLTSDLVSNDLPDFRAEITPYWEKLYVTKNPAISQRFIERGIILQEEERYFLSNKVQGFIGYNTPWSLISSYFKNGKI